MKKLFSFLIVLLFVIFILIYASSSSNYYEYSNNQKRVFTEEKIKEFEKDVSEGKNININDYLVNETKDYSNKVTNLGNGISDLLNKSVNYILRGSFKAMEKIIK